MRSTHSEEDPDTAPRGRDTVLSSASTRARIARLELTVLRKIDGVLLGNYQGLIPGPGSEPGESREYQVGDDVRLMDWSVTARTTVPHVHQTIADRELETWLLVDLSPSVDAGSHIDESGNVVTKRDLALAASATFGLLASNAGNRVGVVIVGGADPVIVPPSAGKEHVRSILELVATTPSAVINDDPTDDEDAAQAGQDAGQGRGGSSDAGAQSGGLRGRAARAWQRIRPRKPDRPEPHKDSGIERGATALRGLARRRGLIVVISDFLGDMDWERSLRVLSTRQQIVSARVTDPLDVALPQIGNVSLRDPVSGEVLDVDVNAEQAANYQYAARRHRREVVTALRHCGAPILALRTDRDWVRDVIEFAGMRRRGAFPDGERALADLEMTP
ncbi:MAG TPA: DUF58 domain-containing protein [Dietzia timorensis]|uniref:DUF58 domain-containing protein n=1 Tax=Dietzia timorensis TaxID=499555 RepID=A0A921K014_9ACTN|nr:DUF58 domain-containing protein [Dietzia timorensis]HJE91536.1 DUF58 domain-containing protein [Dietzia timorensis]